MLLRGSKWELNARNKCDGRDLLCDVAADSVPLVFFDPQYRGVLDKLKYGNEGARQKKRAQLPQMGDDCIQDFFRHFARIVKPTGHVMLWLDKFHVVERTWEKWNYPCLQAVDLITWEKPRIGMGYRTRRKCEYLLILQKEPKRARDVWTDHGIPDVWTHEMEWKSGYSVDRVDHPHAKPMALQRRLILATTKIPDMVVDPCAGSFSVMQACRLTNRRFLGCDLNG